LVAALRRERQTDQTAPFLGHEVDRLRGDELGGHRQVALVLAVRIVDDDHHLALADVLDRVGDRGKRRLNRAHRPSPISFSTYLASTSTSRFTVSPAPACPRLVRCNVSGMRETVNDRSSSSATVSNTPSTAIDPFSITYRRTEGGASIRIRRANPSETTSATDPIPSTWPWTTWPPRRSDARSGSSRLTSEPGSSRPKDVRDNVSFIASATNEPLRKAAALRHTPLTAIESPARSSDTSGVSI